MTQLARLYLSGEVRRYHHNPVMARLGQTNADHQGRCVQLLLALHPAPSMGLIQAAALHDVGELVAGDLGSDFKRGNPGLAHAHADLEHAAAEAITGFHIVLTGLDARWLKLVDRLEAHCHALVHAPAEYDRHGSGWRVAGGDLADCADDLGCGDAVRGLFHDLRAGAW